jgi:hypothetical protein
LFVGALESEASEASEGVMDLELAGFVLAAVLAGDNEKLVPGFVAEVEMHFNHRFLGEVEAVEAVSFGKRGMAVPDPGALGCATVLASDPVFVVVADAASDTFGTFARRGRVRGRAVRKEAHALASHGGLGELNAFEVSHTAMGALMAG